MEEENYKIDYMFLSDGNKIIIKTGRHYDTYDTAYLKHFLYFDRIS